MNHIFRIGFVFLSFPLIASESLTNEEKAEILIKDCKADLNISLDQLSNSYALTTDFVTLCFDNPFAEFSDETALYFGLNPKAR